MTTLTNIRNIGRFKNEEGKSVNIKKGTRPGYGTDEIFYLYRGKRIFVSDREFYHCWIRV